MLRKLYLFCQHLVLKNYMRFEKTPGDKQKVIVGDIIYDSAY